MPICLDSLVAAFEKRSKAILYSYQMAITRCRLTESREYMVVDIRRWDRVTIQFTFEALGFVAILIAHRRINKRVRRLARLHSLHIDDGPAQLVARCEKTISIGRSDRDDDWWRTIGQPELETLWLAIGT